MFRSVVPLTGSSKDASHDAAKADEKLKQRPVFFVNVDANRLQVILEVDAWDAAPRHVEHTGLQRRGENGVRLFDTRGGEEGLEGGRAGRWAKLSRLPAPSQSTGYCEMPLPRHSDASWMGLL